MTDFKLHHFTLKEEGLKCILEMPERPVSIEIVGNLIKNKSAFKLENEYRKALESAIASAVLVSNQDEVLDQLWRHDERINNPIPFLFWKENMLPRPKDAVYSLECAVEVKEYCSDYAESGRPFDCPINGSVAHSRVALVTFPQSKEDRTLQSTVIECYQENIKNPSAIVSIFYHKGGIGKQTELRKQVIHELQILLSKEGQAKEDQLIGTFKYDFEKGTEEFIRREDQPGEADKVEENRAQLSVWHEVEQLVCRPAGFLIHPEVLELLMKSYHITRKNYEG
jgi:hypothetical protein